MGIFCKAYWSSGGKSGKLYPTRYNIFILIFEKPLDNGTSCIYISILGILSTLELSRFRQLTQEVGKLIYDDETFKLFTLVLLFSNVDHNHPESLSSLQNSYLNVIRRRLNIHSFEDFSLQNYDTLAMGNLVYSKFNTCILAINELTHIVQKLMAKLNG